jgi:uncharacterized protein YndB with AHSA1/START domain
MSIELTRTIGAPTETVFRALTDAGELSRWWTTTAESDARTGGAFSYGFEFADPARDHTYTGVYDEVVPGELIRYPWRAGVGDTTVEVELRPAGDGVTELTLRHTGWESGAEAEEAVSLHEQGWSFFLDNLVGYLERGDDVRPSSPMGQKTPAAV